MRNRSLVKSIVAVSLFLLSGCDVAHSMRDDLVRLSAAPPAAAKPATRPAPPRRPQPAATAVAYDMPPAPTVEMAAAAADTAPAKTAAATPPPAIAPPAVTLAGKSESELRTLLGPPASEEDRPPGKRWHYRTGQCTLDLQLYPDVQTKQFGTLAYEVKSDDNTDEGKRLCMAQFQSRAPGGN
jgi:hypothetical protein